MDSSAKLADNDGVLNGRLRYYRQEVNICTVYYAFCCIHCVLMNYWIMYLYHVLGILCIMYYALYSMCYVLCTTVCNLYMFVRNAVSLNMYLPRGSYICIIHMYIYISTYIFTGLWWVGAGGVTAIWHGYPQKWSRI